VRILFLDQFSEMGGAQRVLLDTLQAVRRRDWQAVAVLPPGGPLVKRLRDKDVPVTEIPCGPYRSGAKNLADFFRFGRDVRKQTRAISDLISETHFDLVYVNGPRLLPAAASAVGGRLPMLFHLHYPLHKSYAAQLARWSIRRADATVVACSRAVRDGRSSYARPDRLHVIPNGVPEMPFRGRTFVREGPWRIGLVGRISPQKGQIEFLRASALLTTEFPAARFIICGAPLFGAEKYYAQVQSLARGLPVDFLGWREDVGNVLSELDLLVAPSKDEGMPLALLEAFSAGLPVIAFPAGGIAELVSDGHTGFLVPESTPEALAARIREMILGPPERLRQAAIHARQAWEHGYTIGLYQERITHLMERLVSEHSEVPETTAQRRRR
jgi:glycosyltransferase involved in cell wall biosynthesis